MESEAKRSASKVTARKFGIAWAPLSGATHSAAAVPVPALPRDTPEGDRDRDWKDR